MKRDASMMVDTQNKRMTPLVSLTQLIKSTKATVSPASVDAAQKTLGPPAPKKTKHKRIRIKTEKRREQCRNNQARYRNRQRGMVNSLDDSIQVLYQEIKKLDVQYQALCYGIQTKQTIWSTAVEYFHLFHLDDVSYVLEKAIITQEYLLGELH
ncbi:hypothetical protein BBO99_00000402 [Phytophthora kernoviae]|uniref:BZIP domain-containing protein n=2 Tax=Phytophthora kernoviae TaxID=325452 RepID=A0A3R7J7L7_9STRA|nr:hypothetical protein G195_001216 [Phytophthora kernoviae 00238/432]RLN14555.1 hypothetical protein BBI17_000415 [Phytophthora kernoviae]RLN85636.1 hypothetical protein BBO99_00000402 [Phytophthora kernoviae]